MTTIDPAHQIRTLDELRTHYRDAAGLSLAKQHDQLDHDDRRFIADAPLLMLATTDAAGAVDVSPRGGPPGWVGVLDAGHLAIPDLAGNNRLDSLANIVVSPGVGLLFVIPGLDETLRVNGDAVITTDPEVLARLTVHEKTPRTAIVVAVRDAYIHCAKAFRRAAAWNPDEWPDRSGRPSIACILRDQAGPDLEVAAVEGRLESSYRSTIWQVGGIAPA
jgi:PPOX class probable FMN-dependent enzyme